MLHCTAVVLLHGLRGTPDELLSLQGPLRQQGYTVVLLRIAGYSFDAAEPECPASPWYSWVQAVQARVLALRQDHDKVVVVSLSAGCALALALSAAPGAVHPAGAVVALPRDVAVRRKERAHPRLDRARAGAAAHRGCRPCLAGPELSARKRPAHSPCAQAPGRGALHPGAGHPRARRRSGQPSQPAAVGAGLACKLFAAGADRAQQLPHDQHRQRPAGGGAPGAGVCAVLQHHAPWSRRHEVSSGRPESELPQSIHSVQSIDAGQVAAGLI